MGDEEVANPLKYCRNCGYCISMEIVPMTLQFGLKELNIGLDNWFVLHCPSDRSLPFSVEFTVYLPFLFSTSPACAKHRSLSWWLGYCRLLSVKIQFTTTLSIERPRTSRGVSLFCLVVRYHKEWEITTLTLDFVLLTGNNGFITKSSIIDLQTYASDINWKLKETS